MSYHLRLIKAISYSNGTLTATAQQPDVFTDDEATASQAVASGYFALIDNSGENIESEPAENAIDYDQLSKLTKEGLSNYALEHGIDISKCKTKADILETISVANGGSYTMIDLMRE